MRVMKLLDVVLEPVHKRPLFGAIVLLVLGLLLGNGRSPWGLVTATVAIGGIVLWRVLKKRAHVAFLSLLIFLIVGYVAMIDATQLSPLTSLLYNQYSSISCRACGTVSDVKNSDYGVRYRLKNVTIHYTYRNIEYEEYEGYINLNASNDDLRYEVGDVIELYGTASAYPVSTNPGEFDLRSYYETQKVRIRVKAYSITCTEHAQSILRKICNQCRLELEKSYAAICDTKSASVFGAMVLGNREELDEELSDLFSMCGIGHILAISGLHISLLGMSFYKLLRRLGIHVVPSMSCGVGFILFYGYMTGNTTSTVRALIMFICCVNADSIKRSYDILSASSLAAILMLLHSPMLLYHSGFLLSYGAILGVALVNRAFCRCFPAKSRLARAFLGSLSIQLVTTPITLWFYYQLPTWSVLLNLIVIPLMTILMISAVAGGVIGIGIPQLGKFCIGPAVYVIRFYEWICRLNLKLPYAVLTLGRPKTWQMILYYGVLILFVYLAEYSSKRRHAVLPVAGIFFLCLRVNHKLQVTFLDVGQGDGIFLRAPNGMTMLIDGGSTSNQNVYDYIIEEFLLSEGVTHLNYCVMTHADEDHINGMMELLLDDTFTVDCVIVPATNLQDQAYQKVLDCADAQNVPVIEISAGMSIQADELAIDCIHPGMDFVTQEHNCYSTSLWIRFKEFSLLTCGDLCEEEEWELYDTIASAAPIDVVKANHHGSRNSNTSEFYEASQAKTVVISCGRNNQYNHPHEEAIQRIEKIGAQIWRTDRNGAIRITSDGRRYEVQSYIK